MESCAVTMTVEVLPTSTVQGSHCAFAESVCGAAAGGAGRGRRRWQWWRRHVNARARVVADADLPVPIIGERVVRATDERIAFQPRHVPAQAAADEEPLARLEGDAHGRAREILGVR